MPSSHARADDPTWLAHCLEHVKKDLHPDWKTTLKTANIKPNDLCSHPDVLNDLTPEQRASMPDLPAWLQTRTVPHKYKANNKWEAQRAAALLASVAKYKEPCRKYDQELCAENAHRCAWNPIEKDCSDIRRNETFETPEAVEQRWLRINRKRHKDANLNQQEILDKNWESMRGEGKHGSDLQKKVWLQLNEKMRKTSPPPRPPSPPPRPHPPAPRPPPPPPRPPPPPPRPPHVPASAVHLSRRQSMPLGLQNLSLIL